LNLFERRHCFYQAILNDTNTNTSNCMIEQF